MFMTRQISSFWPSKFSKVDFCLSIPDAAYAFLAASQSLFQSGWDFLEDGEALTIRLFNRFTPLIQSPLYNKTAYEYGVNTMTYDEFSDKLHEIKDEFKRAKNCELKTVEQLESYILERKRRSLSKGLKSLRGLDL